MDKEGRVKKKREKRKKGKNNGKEGKLMEKGGK